MIIEGTETIYHSSIIVPFIEHPLGKVFLLTGLSVSSATGLIKSNVLMKTVSDVNMVKPLSLCLGVWHDIRINHVGVYCLYMLFMRISGFSQQVVCDRELCSVCGESPCKAPGSPGCHRNNWSPSATICGGDISHG